MFSNKIKVFLLTSICLIFFFLTYNDVKSKEITTHNLLDNFNICQTNSSLGQYCKDERFNYLEYFKNSKIQINNNKIHYEFDTWDYHFEITKRLIFSSIVPRIFKSHCPHTFFIFFSIILVLNIFC